MSMVQELGRLSVSGVQAKSFRNPYFLTPQLRAAKRRTAGGRSQNSEFRSLELGSGLGIQNSGDQEVPEGGAFGGLSGIEQLSNSLRGPIR